MLKEETQLVMNSKEETLECILLKHGFSRSKARCMIFMLEVGAGTSKEMEHVMNLRQPEVSTSMKELCKQKMVKIIIRKIGSRKGRPEKIYALAKDKELLLADIEREMNRNIEKTMRTLKELKKIVIK